MTTLNKEYYASSEKLFLVAGTTGNFDKGHTTISQIAVCGGMVVNMAMAFLETVAEDGESFMTLFHSIACCCVAFALDINFRQQHYDEPNQTEATHKKVGKTKEITETQVE